MKEKIRLDVLLTQRGLFPSREKARAAIMAGEVLVNEIKTDKAGASVDVNSKIRLLGEKLPYVSRGGLKLEKALKCFNIDMTDKTVIDIGASTGGFVDCALQNGAKKVYAVDVGESLLHDSLLQNTKIVQMNNTNARYLTKNDFNDAIDGVVTDVSFISLRLIFPTIKNILKDNGEAVVLVKPQFECENKNIGKSGIVHPSAHAKIVKKVLGYATENGLYPLGITNAPIRKGKNVEYVLWLKPNYQDAASVSYIVNEVKNIVSNEITEKNTKENSLGGNNDENRGTWQ